MPLAAAAKGDTGRTGNAGFIQQGIGQFQAVLLLPGKLGKR